MTTNHTPKTDAEIDAFNLERQKLNDALPNFCTPLPLLKKNGEIDSPSLNSKEKAEDQIQKIRKKSSPESSPSELYLSYFK